MNRRQFVYLLSVLSLAAFATALVLLHAVAHQTLQGSRTDPADPDAPAEDTVVRVECASPASGPRLDGEGNKVDIGALEDADAVAEDNGWELDQQGIDTAEVTDVCGRVRSERVAHAGELGVVGLLLAGWAVLLGRGPGRDPDTGAAPRAGTGNVSP